jgi:glycosyltransferase involved in cell wall biosynthesis
MIKCGIIGSIVEIKGYDRVIEILEKNKEISLLVSGVLWNSNAQPTLDFLKSKEEYLGNLEVEEKYLGEGEFETCVNELDILLFPYHIVTASGMFCRLARYLKPTITWNLPYFKEIEEKYGACITVNSVDELEEAITKVNESEELKDKLKKGMENFIEETSWEKVAKKHMKVYKKLIEEKI